MKLDIGSGDNPIEGYIGVDLYATNPDIIKAPMWELPFGDKSVDVIYSSHALEHIERSKVLPTLQEWFRVLKNGGEVDLRVPDGPWCLRYYLDYIDRHETIFSPVLGWELSIIIGSQEDEGMIHRMLFTEKSLYYFLVQAGFFVQSITKIFTHNQSTLRAIAHRLKD
jgi:predicted SAM-dependent methyltransferase